MAKRDIYCVVCKTKREHEFEKGTLEKTGEKNAKGEDKVRQTKKGKYGMIVMGGKKMARGKCPKCGTQTSVITGAAK